MSTSQVAKSRSRRPCTGPAVPGRQVVAQSARARLIRPGCGRLGREGQHEPQFVRRLPVARQRRVREPVLDDHAQLAELAGQGTGPGPDLPSHRRRVIRYVSGARPVSPAGPGLTPGHRRTSRSWPSGLPITCNASRRSATERTIGRAVASTRVEFPDRTDEQRAWSTAPGTPSGASRTLRRTQPGTGSTRQCPRPGSSGRPLGVPGLLVGENTLSCPQIQMHGPFVLPTTIAPAAFSRGHHRGVRGRHAAREGAVAAEGGEHSRRGGMSSIMTPTPVQRARH
jgi:hypothetical protein